MARFFYFLGMVIASVLYVLGLLTALLTWWTHGESVLIVAVILSLPMSLMLAWRQRPAVFLEKWRRETALAKAQTDRERRERKQELSDQRVEDIETANLIEVPSAQDIFSPTVVPSGDVSKMGLI